jgi:hypothetical protein
VSGVQACSIFLFLLSPILSAVCGITELPLPPLARRCAPGAPLALPSFVVPNTRAQTQPPQWACVVVVSVRRFVLAAAARCANPCVLPILWENTPLLTRPSLANPFASMTFGGGHLCLPALPGGRGPVYVRV